MKTNPIKGYGCSGYDIRDINLLEMQQMCEMKTRVKNVIDNHADPNAKKEYISDDELKTIYAMLSIITRDVDSKSFTSEFDKFLSELDKPKEKEESTEESDPKPETPEYSLF